jgi:hypothetical protein
MEQQSEMDYAGARVQKMATYRIWITTPSGFVPSMHIWHTREEKIELLAILANRHQVLGKFRVQTTLS